MKSINNKMHLVTSFVTTITCIHAFTPIISNNPILIPHNLKSKPSSTSSKIQPFIYSSRSTTTHSSSSLNQSSSSSSNGLDDGYSTPPGTQLSQEQQDTIQWNQFLKYHARGKWRGTWMTYDFMGDVIDNIDASVNLEHDPKSDTVFHTHEIVVVKKQADCLTCFDSTTVKTIPIKTYTPGNLAKYRCASNAMVCGPSLIRSQSGESIMSTELIISHGNGRLRVMYQHAPVWEAGVEPGSCPPQGLKLFRTLISREILNENNPPSQRGEMEKVPKRGNPKFFRPVPPYMWHKMWGGTSWTWGPQNGDRGWSIAELEEADAWHGRPTGDTDNVWSLRLPGGVLLQCPRVITSGIAENFRLAWLPEDDAEVGTADDGDAMKLLRVEASVVALEPIIDEENEGMMIGFYPPMLTSLRADNLVKTGELEGVSMLEKLKNMGEEENVSKSSKPVTSESKPSPEISTKPETNIKNDADDDSGLNAIRNALRL